MSKKDKAFALFDEGKTSASPEVKALKLKGTTRYNYYYEWQKNKGTPRISSAPSSEAKAAAPANEAKVRGKVISELEMITESAEEVNDEKEGEKEEKEEKKESPESKEKPEEKSGTDGKKSPPTMVAGQGLTFAITISTKTLMLYQFAATHQDDELTLGDFIDACVEDAYLGRGLDLGLVKIGGK